MFKRKIIIIDRSLQVRYAGVIIATMIITIIMVYVGAYQYKIWFAPPGSSQAISGFATFLTLMFICLGILVTIFAIFASHKFAGPIYRFKKTLDSLAEGDLTVRAFLREKDELKDVQDKLNKAIISIQTRVINDKNMAGNIRDLLKGIKTSLSKSPAQDNVTEIIQKIEKAEHQLNEIGNKFKS